MTARRSKAELDPAILDKVISVLSIGAGRTAAAAQAGIVEETLRNYERWGREAWTRREAASEEGRDANLSPREALFADFYARLLRAETNTKTYMLGLITKAATGDWKAGAWMLEKLFPEEFGKQRLDVAHSGSVRTSGDLSKLTVDELLTLRRLRAKLDEDDEP